MFMCESILTLWEKLIVTGEGRFDLPFAALYSQSNNNQNRKNILLGEEVLRM